MKCQFNDLFKDTFGEIDYSVKEKLWMRFKTIPIIGPMGNNLLKAIRVGGKILSGLILKKNLETVPRKKGKDGFVEFPIFKFKSGDIVKVRSREQIEQTLDEKNQFEGVEFMETMWPYCGETHRVFKRVERILDPYEDRLRKCKNMVILEGLFCHGDPAHALECDRTCLYYWKESWLERIK